MKRMLLFLIVMSLIVSRRGIAQDSATLTIRSAEGKATISRNIYGMFSEDLGRDIYDGFWVGDSSAIPNADGIRLDLVQAFKKIHIPVLRWPGGCFADEYHWRDGIGPRDQRPKIVNTHWGMVTQDNGFGTHEFMRLCAMLGSAAYIAGNMGSGTVREMSEWVEYINSGEESAVTRLRQENGRAKPWRVQYWGVGNESWGCGGNMTPEHYSDLYRRYATFCRNYPGAPLKRIASGPNGNDTHWMEVLMKNIPHHLMWGVSLHYYTLPTGDWNHKGSATDFEEDEYFGALKRALGMDKVIGDQVAIMNQYDPEKQVALVVDEWGIWTDAEPGSHPGFLYQQNSLRDALTAASTLNIFNRHCDRVKMANLAQTVNVLQALALTRGKEMVLTPTYYVFDLYQVHQDATLLPSRLTAPQYRYNNQAIPAVNASASLDSTGVVHISLVNLDPHKRVSVHTVLKGKQCQFVRGRILTAEKFNDHNTFEDPDRIRIRGFYGVKKTTDGLVIRLPPMSVVVVDLH